MSSFGTVTSLLEMTPSSRVWIPGPRASTMNLFAAVHAAELGAHVVPDLSGATHAHLTPSALSRVCAERPQELAGVQVLVAGDRLVAALAEAATSCGARVSHYYGAAELSFVAWGSHEENLSPFPGVEVTVREAAIWVRSAYLCDGYQGQPGPFLVDRDGWATVGDRGEMSAGHLRVHGRGTDTVITGGATVVVADVESVLRPAARGAVHVLGLPHPDLGQVVAGVLTEAADLEPVRMRSRDALPVTHWPRRWFHVAELPLTAAGKVDRAALCSLLVSPWADRMRLVR